VLFRSIEIVGGGNFEDFAFKLFYEFDPAQSGLGVNAGFLDFSVGDGSGTTIFQDSQNLLFSFLANSLIPGVTAPMGVTSFDPNAEGQYSFALIASQGGIELGRSAIDVNVSAVPLPAALPLFGTGLAIMGFVGWRRRKVATA